MDGVIEGVRQDPELDEQEQMLLGCIVYIVPLELPCRNITWHLWTSRPSPTHSSFYSARRSSTAPLPARIPVQHPQRAWDHQMSTAWISGDRENTDSEGIGEGSCVWNVGSVPI